MFKTIRFRRKFGWVGFLSFYAYTLHRCSPYWYVAIYLSEMENSIRVREMSRKRCAEELKICATRIHVLWISNAIYIFDMNDNINQSVYCTVLYSTTHYIHWFHFHFHSNFTISLISFPWLFSLSLSLPFTRFHLVYACKHLCIQRKLVPCFRMKTHLKFRLSAADVN